MDSLTQFFISEYTDILSIGFIANVMIFMAFLEGMASIISSFRHVGR